MMCRGVAVSVPLACIAVINIHSNNKEEKRVGIRIYPLILSRADVHHLFFYLV